MKKIQLIITILLLLIGTLVVLFLLYRRINPPIKTADQNREEGALSPSLQTQGSPPLTGPTPDAASELKSGDVFTGGNAPLVVQAVFPSSRTISPASPIVIQFTQQINANLCQVSSNQAKESYRATVNDQSLGIIPASVWPEQQNISFKIVCNGQTKDLFFTVQSTKELSEQEQFSTGAAIESSTARETAQYYADKSYVNQFPLIREKYFLLFVVDKNVIVVISQNGTPFTIEERKQIESTERPNLTALGVPSSIPLIFQE